MSSLALLIRACWPFAPEILGLELCPLQSSSGADITYGQRSRGLHRLLVADNIARFIGAAFVGSALTGMLLGSCLFVKGTSTGDWTWNGWFDHLLLPATLWIVGTVVAVFRFLSYLDSRIRLEGWEIELRLRAEADRLLAAERGPVVSAGESQEATPV